ncbi:MAG: cell division protein FtsL [Candidatus Zixiibacteriota bacterium]
MKNRLIRALRLLRPSWWILAVAIATAWVWQRYAVVRLGEEVERAQGRIVALTRLRDHLLVENTALARRERIESIAVQQLGMRPTTRQQRHRLAVSDTSAPAPGGERLAGSEEL